MKREIIEIIVAVLSAVIVIGVIVKSIIDKKHGKGCIDCDCSNCSGCSKSCNNKKEK